METSTAIVDLKEQEFHNKIRDSLVIKGNKIFKSAFYTTLLKKQVFFFIYVILCSIAYFVISKLRKLNERDDSVLGTLNFIYSLFIQIFICILRLLDYEDAVADWVRFV